MAKRQIREKNKDIKRKTMGRSWGSIVTDPVLGDNVSPKMLNSRKNNNPNRYKV